MGMMFSTPNHGYSFLLFIVATFIVVKKVEVTFIVVKKVKVKKIHQNVLYPCKGILCSDS
jgi:hypothetical protein